MLSVTPHFSSMDAGRELGISPWERITQDQIDRFAECTGDRQWMHVDPERCGEQSPFGAPVAHGLLSLSLLARLSSQLSGVPRGVVGMISSGFENVRFRTPILVGTSVRARARILDVTPMLGNRRLVRIASSLEAEGRAPPAVTAEMHIVFF